MKFMLMPDVQQVECCMSRPPRSSDVVQQVGRVAGDSLSRSIIKHIDFYMTLPAYAGHLPKPGSSPVILPCASIT